MLRLLLQAGVGFATFNAGQRIANLKRTATFLALAGLIALLGLGALVAAAVIALVPHLGPAGAAAAVGGGLLAIAGLVGFIGTRKRKPRAPTPIFERVRAEVGAVAGAASEARVRAKASGRRFAQDVDSISDDMAETVQRPVLPGARRKKALNIMLFATLAGIVLGRRL